VVITVRALGFVVTDCSDLKVGMGLPGFDLEQRPDSPIPSYDPEISYGLFTVTLIVFTTVPANSVLTDSEYV
jgi:hypothetical protein